MKKCVFRVTGVKIVGRAGTHISLPPIISTMTPDGIFC